MEEKAVKYNGTNEMDYISTWKYEEVVGTSYTVMSITSIYPSDKIVKNVT